MTMTPYLKDLAERVATTFVAGFLGAVSLDLASITDLGWSAWLIAGAGAGVVSVLKGLLARLVGSASSASLAPSLAMVDTTPRHFVVPPPAA